MESQGIYESLFRDYAYDLVGPKQDYIAGSTRRQPEPTLTEKKETENQARKQERFNEIKNLPINKEEIRDYFVGKEFGGKRILAVENVVQKIERGNPRKIVTLLVESSGGKSITETIDITDSNQINNLLDQLSDPGVIPTGNLPIKK